MLQPGDSVGEYRVIRQLTSKTWTTCLVHSPLTGRDVILTTLPTSEAPEGTAAYIRAAARVRHRSIQPIIDHGRHESALYLVTLPLAVGTLADVFDRGTPVDFRRRLFWVRQLCAAVAAMHAEGVVHGHIHPGNVIVPAADDGIMLDLRAAVVGRVSGGGSSALAEPGYTAPEQLLGAEANERSDVFSLGAVCYAILASTPPFPGDTEEAVRQKLLNGQPASLLLTNPAVPEKLGALVMRALRNNPGDRMQSVDALVVEADRALPPEEMVDTVTIPLLETPREQMVLVLQEDVLGSRPAAPAGPPPLTAPVERAIALDENVQFTVFRPRAIAPAVWHTMLVFAHLSEPRPDARPDEPHPVKEMERQAEAILGDLESYRNLTADSDKPVPRDGELTFVPRAEGITFNPASRSFMWTESVHREEFRLRADAVPPTGVVRGRVSVFLGSVIIAEVGVTFRLGVDADPFECERVRDVARRYRKIFASYSHRDRGVVDEFTEYARAMGDRYLRDVIELRAGERWQGALEELIRQADVFQLFWSWNALTSPHVRHEWQYALSLQRPSFIRPVYWDDPLPAHGDLPPAALSAIHFERIRPRRSTQRDPAPPAGAVSRPPRPSPVSPEPRDPAPPPRWSPEPATIASRPAPPARRPAPWRIMGSIAAGIVLVVIGAGLWLPGSAPETNPPATRPSPVPTDTGPKPAPPVTASARLSIRVNAPDAEIASEAEAELVDADSGETVADGAADGEGNIVLENVARGRYRLIVSVPDRPDIVRTVRLDGDQTIAIDLDGR